VAALTRWRLSQDNTIGTRRFSVCLLFCLYSFVTCVLYFVTFLFLQGLVCLNCTFIFTNIHFLAICEPKPMSARPMSWVCGHSLAGIAGSIQAGGMDICLL
jgi:hypothetical protein